MYNQVSRNNKKFQLRKLNLFFYDNSPRNEVSKMVLKTAGATFCPKRYINLVTAASVVLSLPDITPIFFHRFPKQSLLGEEYLQLIQEHIH